MKTILPVLIVGAGPTGLTAAIELKRRNIPFQIIDKALKPVQTSNALAVQTRTLEIWDDELVLDQAPEEGTKISHIRTYALGKKIVDEELAFPLTPYPYLLGLAQADTEKRLLAWLTKRDITVAMNTELVDFISEPDGVTATLKTTNGETQTFAASWILACDGLHSVTRNKLGIRFEGQDLPQHFVFADVELAETETQQSLYNFLPKAGVLALLPFNRKQVRVIAEVTNDPQLGKATSLVATDIEALLKERACIPLTVTRVHWTSGFWLHEKLAERYREERVFLLGDAAHVHSPVGGQGMNTGIQDAYNLAWKLALVLKGQADEHLLETYQHERRPVAAAVLKGSTMMTKLIANRSWWVGIIRARLLASLFHWQRFRERFTATITELLIDYHSSRLTQDLVPTNNGPKPGMKMLDVTYGGSGKLLDAIRGTKFRLLFFVGTARHHDRAISIKNQLQQAFPGLMKFVMINRINDFSFWDEKKVFDIQGEVHQAYDASAEPLLYLIRPDKYISMRCHFSDEHALRDFIQRMLSSLQEA